MAGVVDADTHVVESEEMWEFFDEKLSHRKPVLLTPDRAESRRGTYWLIDGNATPKPEGKGGGAGQTPPRDAEGRAGRSWRTKALLDVEARLEDADAMGVDVQVVFPTLFIHHMTYDPVLNVALAQSYNRFMADACARGKGRLRWIAVPPFLDVQACIQELRWARDHGAVGFNARGIEGERFLADEYFFPIYEEASRLNMPLCIHTGAGAPAFTAIIDTRLTGSFTGIRMLPVMAFQHLVTNRVPERFPDLRIGFIETSASWVPYALHYIERDWRRKKQLDIPHLGPELFEDYRIFVACESDEDIPYLAQAIGWDHLITGSDYGHHGNQLPTIEATSFTNRLRGGDPTADVAVVGTLRGREDMPAGAVDKILVDNPRRFYGL